MSLPFALRSRLRFREEPERVRAPRLPAFAMPVASYWVVMGLLTYGVASGALRPERLASLRWMPDGTFTSSRLVEPPAVTPQSDYEPPRDEPPHRVPGSIPSPSVPSDEPLPLAAAEPSMGLGGAPSASDRVGGSSRAAPSAVRPLAGLSLGSSSLYGGEDTREEPAEPREDRDSDGVPGARAASRASASHGRTARLAVEEPPPRDVPLPMPGEFQPAARGAVALRDPRRRASAPSARGSAEDPWPGFSDEEPSPSARTAPRAPSNEPVAAREREPVHAPPPAPASLGSCEAAMAGANEVIDMNAGRGAPDVTRGAYASLLERGGYLMPCGVPAGMALEVCAAVRDGHAVGITVGTRPADGRVRACVRNAVAAMAFPRSPRLDVTRTRFDSARR